jgi:hypothetical protein
LRVQLHCSETGIKLGSIKNEDMSTGALLSEPFTIFIGGKTVFATLIANKI